MILLVYKWMKQAINMTVNFIFVHGVKVNSSVTCHNSVRGKVPPSAFSKCSALRTPATFLQPSNTAVMSLVLRDGKLTYNFSH